MIARYGENDYGYSEAGYGYGVSAFTGFDGLDAVGDLLGWWSVSRRVLARYNGPAIRLRRSSDSTEQDFYGIGPQGEVSTAAVRAFNGWNLFSRTAEFDHTYWTKAEVTVGNDVAIAPDGTSSADRITETLNNTYHRIQRALSFTAGAPYTFSVYVKKESSSRFLILNGNTALGVRASLNLDTLEVVNLNGSGAQVTDAGNGWYRFSITGTALLSSSTLFITMSNSGAVDLAYLGDGSSFLIWGAQLEQSASVSTYEPRTTTAAGDSFLVTLYDQSGLARNFTQSTTTLQPIICEQGVPVTENGRLAAKFVAADARRMSIASSTGLFNALHTTGGSILCVSKCNDTAAAKVILSSASSSTGAGFRMTTGSNEVIGYSTGRLDVAGVATTGNSVVLNGANSQASSLRINAAVLDPDNGTAASRISYWEDGTQGASTNAQTGTPFVENAADNMTLGATSAGGSPHDGTFCEGAIFSAAISTADRTAYQSRSGIFYGVTIS